LAEAVEMEIKLFAEFPVPLGLNAGGGENENAFGCLGDEEITEN